VAAAVGAHYEVIGAGNLEGAYSYFGSTMRSEARNADKEIYDQLLAKPVAIAYSAGRDEENRALDRHRPGADRRRVTTP
jgi:hypothetical protein